MRIWFGALGLLAVIALGTLAFVLTRPPERSDGAMTAPTTPSTAGTPALAYSPQAIGLPVVGHPVITHVAIADLDQDGLMDVLVCDATANTVNWIRQFPRGVFTERPIGDPVPGPAHVAVCDLNQDGRLDLLVASMGIVLPNNDRIGQVIVLENLGDGRFRNRVLAEHIARVTDVRAADLNGDGRLDLVVGQFGYTQGEIRWMENLGNWEFRSHPLLDAPGTIMTPVADYDQDGRMDFAALVSQDAEEVHLFQNLGDGNFRDSILWKAKDESWSSSGLDVADLNRDGLPDLVYSNGDGFNTGFTGPAPWHGLQWLENRGAGKFAFHRIGDMPGCYSPVCADLNGDGFMDIVTVSGFNYENDPKAVWLMAWLNDGHEHFTPVPLAHEPTHLITVAAGDLDGNGVPVLVTGGFHAYPPFTQMSRVTLWRRR
jgi:FG-GAP-like repeat